MTVVVVMIVMGMATMIVVVGMTTGFMVVRAIRAMDMPRMVVLLGLGSSGLFGDADRRCLVSKATDLASQSTEIELVAMLNSHRAGNHGDIYLPDIRHASNRLVDLCGATRAIHAFNPKTGLAPCSGHFGVSCLAGMEN